MNRMLNSKTDISDLTCKGRGREERGREIMEGEEEEERGKRSRREAGKREEGRGGREQEREEGGQEGKGGR